MHNRFEGWYFKHQKDGRTLALIPGRSREHAFIQVVTDGWARNTVYPLDAYQRRDHLTIAGNTFARDGIELVIKQSGISLTGRLDYGRLTPIRSDIMGPFRFFPMECRHSVVSMNHRLSGRLLVNGEVWDFEDGRGYIEGDSGRSFPSRYAWVQCCFGDECSIMASIARIPFAGLRFWGCICALWLDGREYRLATYLGARIREISSGRLEITQGRLRLVIEATPSKGHGLPAPDHGKMCRVIHETPSATVRFCLTRDSQVIFDRVSPCASFEYVE